MYAAIIWIVSVVQLAHYHDNSAALNGDTEELNNIPIPDIPVNVLE